MRSFPGRSCVQFIEPHYPKHGNGRPPIGLERMFRMHFVQHWFNLADQACEEALLDSMALRRFVGINLSRERVPDAGIYVVSPSTLASAAPLVDSIAATIDTVEGGSIPKRP